METGAEDVSPPTDLSKHQSSWCPEWLRWIPTSPELLAEAEASITRNISSLDSRGYVTIDGSEEGPCEGPQKEGLCDGSPWRLWTLRANTGSPLTPVVLVHGFGSGSALWCLNIDAIAQDRPVYAFDILGFGRSSRPGFPAGPEAAEAQFVGSIEAWRRRVGLSAFVLVGHSFGGFLAAAYALQHPQRVLHLVLADPWGFPPRPATPERPLPLWAKAISALSGYLNPLGIVRASGRFGPGLLQRARPDLARKFQSVCSSAEQDVPKYLYHCNAQNPTGESAFHSLLSGLGWARRPMAPRLGPLAPPVTFVYGARSWVTPGPGLALARARPQQYVDVRILPDSSHHVYADRSDLFNAIVRSAASFADRGEAPPPTPLPPMPPGEVGGEEDLKKLYDVRNHRVANGEAG